MIRLAVRPEEVAVLRHALDQALHSISEAHPEDRARLGALVERLEAASAPVRTGNEGWGFYGTLVQGGVEGSRAAALFDEAPRELASRLDLTTDEARDVLDAPVGRHMADHALPGEEGAALVARLAGDHKWARRIRKAVRP